jgi:hypothetical protein
MEELAAGRHLDVPDAYRDFSVRMVRHLFSLQKPVPRHLFHYTSLSAMKAIVESSRLWASHAAFLNDSSELRYSHTIFQTTIQELVVAEQTEVGREYLQRALRAIDPFDGTWEVFLLCLCEDGDLLSQWRSYATGAAGYSLGFEAGELNTLVQFSAGEAGLEQPLSCTLRKVNYDRAQHVSVIRDIVHSVLAILKALSPGMTAGDAGALIADAIAVTRDHLFEFYPFFKDPGFREENEWRLVFSFGLSTDRTTFWKFRALGTHLVPYLDIRAAVRSGVKMGRLPIGRVTVGPVASPGLAEAAIRLFLKRYRYEFTEVVRSVIPLR